MKGWIKTLLHWVLKEAAKRASKELDKKVARKP